MKCQFDGFSLYLNVENIEMGIPIVRFKLNNIARDSDCVNIKYSQKILPPAQNKKFLLKSVATF